ncbi:cytochrome c1 [Brevundimonas sp. 2R-24]|uniref:Cytochrome c1 n=1 Tax=Peiella sedimenti TaxID=3061083 RepID=A0ABT8SI84_9CAUL|nr:cytochrome c1 [Caulobacteraceae bacterium XZ-24]
MTRSIVRILAGAGAALGLMAAAAPSLAASGGAEHPRDYSFSFEGPFGTFDRNQLQRGYRVYKEVCAACHGMNLLSFRNLGQPGGPFWDERWPNPNDNLYVKAIAAEFEIADIDSETGEAITRPGTPADRFPEPYPNATAAAAANGGAAPPDLSVMAKARHDGADYIASLLTGYRQAPAGLRMAPGQNYNIYMTGDMSPFWEGDPDHVPPGGFIAMPNPLQNGQVTYDDGTEATVDQMAQDVAAFIAWASDPRATSRKQTGLAVLIYLLGFTVLTWFSYKRIWRGVAH